MSATPLTPARLLNPLRLDRSRPAVVTPAPRAEKTGVEKAPDAWKIGPHEITDPSGKTTRLARHGVDKYAALRLLKNATVLSGNYPSVEDITDQPHAIDALIERISDTGALFTVYASLYRDASRSILLLDDLH